MANKMELNNFRQTRINTSKPIGTKTLESVKYFLNGRTGEIAQKGEENIKHAAELLVNNAKGTPEHTKGLMLVNEAFEVTIPSKVTKDLTSVLSVFAEVHNLKLNDSAKVSMWESERQGGITKVAKGTPAPKRKKTKRSVPVAKESYTGMGSMDYRDLLDDPSGEYGSLIGEVTIDVRNSLVQMAEESLYTGLETAASNAKIGALYYEAAGILQTSIDTCIGEVRTGGRSVSMFGDYRVVSQITPWVGNGVSAADEVLKQIDDLGYVTNYNGAKVMAVDNFYDYSKSEAIGAMKVWAKQLSKANVYVKGSGEMVDPNHVFLYGGVTTMTGEDVESGEYAFRVDQMAASYFVPERASHVAIVSDTDFQ